MSKIVKTSLEKIVEDAKKSGKYNDETVSEVKVTRLGMNLLSMAKDIEDELVDTETGEVIKIENMASIPDGLSEESEDDGENEENSNDDTSSDSSGESTDEISSDNSADVN